MDVSPNSNPEDDIYMAQPEKFEDEDNPHLILKLNKALYGLQQSGRQWNIKLSASHVCVYTIH